MAHKGRLIVNKELLGCSRNLNTVPSSSDSLTTTDSPDLEDMNPSLADLDPTMSGAYMTEYRT